MAAVGLDADAGNAAEGFELRGERQPAAEFEQAEARLRRLAVVERGDRRRLNDDARRCRAGAQRLGQRE
jgi:hypothetical protein